MTKELSTIKKKLDPVGLTMFGSKFVGFQKMDEYKHLIQPFKEYYYTRKKEDIKTTASQIIRDFNDGLIAPDTFYPYTSQLRTWRKKWDNEILDEMGLITLSDIPKRKLNKLIKTQDDDGKYYIPDYKDLEDATKTLGGELINDVLFQMEADRNNEEDYTSDELMKRKKHILDVFSGVSKMVQGKANLILKASAEKREEAGFMMEFMRAAASGDLKAEEIEDLKKMYQPNQPKVTEVNVK